MTPDLSVVIPVRDGEEHLPGLFDALAAQTLEPGRYEVIVVDNNSGDATADLAGAWARGAVYRHVLHAPGIGPAHARNVGIRHALGRWVVFTDCDTLPEPEWLETLAEAAGRNGVRALEGAVVAWPPDEVGPHTHQISNEAGGKYVTANMAYRRELLEQIGGFDERFEQAFLEDSDLAFRALDAGVEIVFLPDARVRHRVLPGSPRTTLRAAKRLRWLPLLVSKHPARYRAQLRPHVNPLSHVDARVLLGVCALAAVPRTRSFARAAAILLAADGLRVGIGRGRRLGSLSLSFALPVAKTFWLLEGRARRRRVTR